MNVAQPPTQGKGLYVHIPWCVKKCPYCDFNSHTQSGPLPEKAYLQKLLEDLTLDVTGHPRQPITSVFFGGGTPSLLSAEFFSEFLQQASHVAEIDPKAEITLEANPGTLECAPFNALKQAGINRISLGIQSLNNRHLASLGRIHSAETARKALDEALSAGFNSVNTDLMFGLPEQNIEEALKELETLTQSGVPHISWYQLTLEPNTVFYNAPPKIPSLDESADISEAGAHILNQAGFKHYEISAFAKPGHSCRHNRNYWQFGDYIGIGAGAHGKLTMANGDVVRTQRTRNPTHYLAHETAHKRVKVKTVPPKDLLFEYCLNRFRLFEAFTLEELLARTQADKSTIKALLDQAQHNGWLSCESPASSGQHKQSDHSHAFYITPKGQLFHNDLVSLFLPE